MQAEMLENYLERICVWARGRTFSEEEAEELAQEITYQAVAGLARLRDESRFEPWLWGVASNCAKAFRRRKGKERALFLYDVPENLLTEAEIPDENEELYGKLREKIAMLSCSYRDIIMLHYYDGLSTKEIAEKLELPEGTVTWRLSEARKRLGKECQDMEESALKPVEMHIDIYGSGEYGDRIPFPTVFIEDALAQNILWQCYEAAKDTEELAKTCGVPAYYVEDRVKDLLKRGALTETRKGRYRTDFVIWTDIHAEYCRENGEAALEPVRDEMMRAMQAFFERIREIPFDRAGRTDGELQYLCGAMAFDYIEREYGQMEYPPIPMNYDGFCWRYLGSRETTDDRIHMTRQVCCPLRDGVPYEHRVYWMKSLGFREMMKQDEIRACWSLLDPQASCEKEWMTQAVRKEFVKRNEDGSFSLAVPVFSRQQKAALDAAAKECFDPVAGRYAECVRQFVKGYRKLFPEHLQDDMKRVCRSLIFSFYEVAARLAVKEGIMAEPNPEWICDVLIEG